MSLRRTATEQPVLCVCTQNSEAGMSSLGVSAVSGMANVGV